MSARAGACPVPAVPCFRWPQRQPTRPPGLRSCCWCLGCSPALWLVCSCSTRHVPRMPSRWPDSRTSMRSCWIRSKRCMRSSRVIRTRHVSRPRPRRSAWCPAARLPSWTRPARWWARCPLEPRRRDPRASCKEESSSRFRCLAQAPHLRRQPTRFRPRIRLPTRPRARRGPRSPRPPRNLHHPLPQRARPRLARRRPPGPPIRPAERR